MNNSTLQALKTALMTQYSRPTRGMSTTEVLNLAYNSDLITKEQFFDYNNAMAPETTIEPTTIEPTAPTIEPTKEVKPMTDKTDAELLSELLLKMSSGKSAPLDEKRVLELINQHSKAPTVVEVALTKASGAVSSNVVGVTHECYTNALNHISVGNDLYFYGRTGAGKSTTATQIAKGLDLPIFTMGAILSKFEVLGALLPSGYVASIVRKWLDSDGGILCIDEIDASCPRALVTIMAIFDLAGELTFPDGETKKRTDNHRVIVTANTTGAGASSDYNGRARLDKATLNRFIRIEHDYSANIENSLASEPIVNYMRTLRQVITNKGIHGSDITPRTIKQAGKIASSNLPVDAKLAMIADTVKQGMTPGEYSSVLLKVNAATITAMTQSLTSAV